MADPYVARVIDLTDPATQRIRNMSIEEARARVASGDPAEAVRAIDGSFALVARVGPPRPPGALARPAAALLPRQGNRGPGARRLGPHRRDPRLPRTGRPRRAVPSELHAHGSGALRRGSRADRLPRPVAHLRALLHAARATLPADPDAIGAALRRRARARRSAMARGGLPERAPVGVAFSGGIDSGAVFLGDLPRHAAAGPRARAPEGVHALRGPPEATAADLAQARASSRRSASASSSSRSRCASGALDPLRGRPRGRGLQAARRRVGDDGARALPRHPGAVPGVAPSRSTATAATRT